MPRKGVMQMQTFINTLLEHGHSYHYMPVGDIVVIGLCILMFALLSQTYIHKSKQARLMLMMLSATFTSAVSNLFCQVAIDSASQSLFLIHSLWLLHQISLAIVLFLYIQYLREPLWIQSGKKHCFPALTIVLAAVTAVADIALSLKQFSFHIADDGTPHMGHTPFSILYLLLMGTLLYHLIHYRSRIIRQIFWGLLSSNLIMILILITQFIYDQASFTCSAYFLPVLGIIFVFHSNPFDIETGAISESYFYDELNENLEKKRSMIIVSCTMSGFFNLIKKSHELKREYYQFLRVNIKKGIIYHFPNDRLVLTFAKHYNVEQDKAIEKIMDNFRESHARFNLDYKMVIMTTTPEITDSNDYIRLIDFVEMTMVENTTYLVSASDIKQFYKNSYILRELESIAHKKDLDDERVLVYCQPVYNISTGMYDTAEALMRLQLDEIGMVYPDQFITLAEQHGLIHAMSMIILNKTCGAIRTLMEDGYEIGRISVNFSTLDLRYDTFCQEVQQIINRNQIPFNKIAIEITESRNDSDFNIMNQKVTQLQKLGIKFYLDDFGTGYSNFERIMEIPFDIIKFDRSMLIESAKSDTSFYMVSTFASMFDKLSYSILFEGIESDLDEKNCVGMRAKYLQGYKYSRPIPIEHLCHFLPKSELISDDSN